MEKHLSTPLTDEKVKELQAGDYVYISIESHAIVISHNFDNGTWFPIQVLALFEFRGVRFQLLHIDHLRKHRAVRTQCQQHTTNPSFHIPSILIHPKHS